ncbi:MAG: nitroreductase family deazaflavin-dependent oxidoreductase [Kineosporiaceae bacterium]|nr:nitroreductase family deazaflavin-dependent oxidoreductase [Kineosporiaceae bacterium]
MPLTGEEEPNPVDWVREQVEAYRASGGREANTLRDTGIPIILVTCRGRRSGALRTFALMRVEHEGQYALVASKGGAPEHPTWYLNVTAAPDQVMIQDGPEPFDVQVRELDGAEREVWWERSVAVYPPYAAYQQRTERLIPVLLATAL